MNERGHGNREPGRLRFSIASLLCLTSLVAIHLAFPSLLIALGATICVSIILALLMFPALSADRMSDSNKDKLKNWTTIYLALVGTTYLIVTAFSFLTLNH
jgi:uncharacterized membrane protein